MNPALPLRARMPATELGFHVHIDELAAVTVTLDFTLLELWILLANLEFALSHDRPVGPAFHLAIDLTKRLHTAGAVTPRLPHLDALWWQGSIPPLYGYSPPEPHQPDDAPRDEADPPVPLSAMFG